MKTPLDIQTRIMAFCVILLWSLGTLPGCQSLAQGADISGIPAAETSETMQVVSRNGELSAQSNTSLWTRKQLTGDWSGLRTDLAEHGVTLDLSLTGFSRGI